MKIGLLWFDNDPKRSLTDKIARAAKRYRQKHGTQPNTCYVHPSTLLPAPLQAGGGNGKTAQVGTIHVAPLPTVLPHHFWLGHEQQL